MKFQNESTKEILLSQLPSTSAELAFICSVTKQTARRYMNQAVKDSEAHILRYELLHARGGIIAVYAIGPAPQGHIPNRPKTFDKKLYDKLRIRVRDRLKVKAEVIAQRYCDPLNALYAQNPTRDIE